MNPKTKEEFDKFSGLLVDKINSFKAKNSLLVGFLEKLFKDLAEPLEFSDIRKLSSTLATLSNEKQRAEKDKKTGKKGAKKAQVRVDAGNDMGPGAFNATEYDEYDDFMWEE